MRSLKGIPSFVLIVGVIWLLLRGLHLIIPAAQPDVMTGPFELESLRGVERITGFQPLVPAYHPISLGDEPVRITAERDDVRSVTIVWRAQRFLELVQQPERRALELPVDAEPVKGRDGFWSWRRGGSTHLRGVSRGLDVELRTNLGREDAVRIASTLVPFSDTR